MAALSRILSCAGDKAFAFFASIKKKEKFEWTSECEEAFTNVKEFLSSPPIYTAHHRGLLCLFTYPCPTTL